MVNSFYVEPGQSFGQGLQSLAGTVDAYGQRQKKERAMQEQKAYEQAAKTAMAEAFQSGDPAKVREAVIQFPEIGETAKQMFGFTNEQTEKVARETYRRALSETDPQRRAAILEGGIETVSQFGGQPRMMMADLQTLQQNPEAFERSAKAGYAALASDQEYEAMFGDGEGSPSIGTYNPRDYTTESFAEFTRTNDPSVLERYASQRSVEIGGVPHVFDPAIGGYRPASIAGGRPEGGEAPVNVTTQDVARSEAEIAAETTRAQEQARQDVSSKGPQEQRASAEARRTAETNISNFQGIVDQAEGLLDNEDYLDAMSGISGRVPAIPGTDRYDAQIAFSQFKDTMTLGNLDKMSGVLTDRDIQVLSSAASGIEPGMSKSALTERLNKIRGVFAQKTQAEREKLKQFMGVGQGQSEDTGSPKRIRLDEEGNIIQ